MKFVNFIIYLSKTYEPAKMRPNHPKTGKDRKGGKTGNAGKDRKHPKAGKAQKHPKAGKGRKGGKDPKSTEEQQVNDLTKGLGLPQNLRDMIHRWIFLVPHKEAKMVEIATLRYEMQKLTTELCINKQVSEEIIEWISAEPALVAAREQNSRIQDAAREQSARDEIARLQIARLHIEALKLSLLS